MGLKFCNYHNAMWLHSVEKSEKSKLLLINVCIKEKFRQINYFAISLVKTLLSRIFCQKVSGRVNFHNNVDGRLSKKLVNLNILKLLTLQFHESFCPFQIWIYLNLSYLFIAARMPLLLLITDWFFNFMVSHKFFSDIQKDNLFLQRLLLTQWTFENQEDTTVIVNQIVLPLWFFTLTETIW